MSTSLFANMPYRVADINLAKKGREEISWVEKEMPGLLAIRTKYKNKKPLQGMRISGSLHITTQTAVFIETLHELGAEVRWCASTIYSTQDHAAAAVAAKGIPIFAWREESLTDYWWAIFQTLHFDNKKGPTHCIDDKGDMAVFIHQGLLGETNNQMLDQNTSSYSQNTMNLFLKRVLAEDQNCWKTLTKDLKLVSEESKSGINRLLAFKKQNALRFPIININSSVVKTQIDNYYSCKETIADSIKMATRTMLIGKSVVICGFGDIGRGCATALKNSGARVSITETDPIRALQAAMMGYEVVLLEDVCKSADLFITATGQKQIISLEHMQQMKDQAIVCNMGHYELEIDIDGLNQTSDIKKVAVGTQLTRYFFPDGHSILLVAEAKLINLSCDTSQLAFIKSCSYTLHILKLIKLQQQADLTIDIHHISREIDQEVSQLHLNSIGAQLTNKHKEQR